MAKTKHRGKLNKANRRKLAFCLCLIALPLIQYCIFYIGVNFNSIRLAFNEYDANMNLVWCGTKNFKDVFRDIFIDSAALWKICILNSLLVWVLHLLLKSPLTLLVAYFTSKHPKVGNFFKVMLFLPSVLSIMVTVMIYQYFGDNVLYKVINDVFGTSYSSLSAETSNRYTIFIFVFMFGFWSGFGQNMLLYVNAMNAIPKSIKEAAKLDGAKGFTEFFRVTFPMIFPTYKNLFIVGVSHILVNQFTLFEFFGLYLPSQRLNTVGYHVYYLTMYHGTGYYPFLAALGIVLTLVAVPLALGARKLLNKIDPMENY